MTQNPDIVIDYAAADRVKAAYLYSFFRFVTWPEITSDTFRVAVLGDSGITKTLQKIARQKSFKDRKSGRSFKIEILVLRSWDQVGDCELLLLGTQTTADDRRLAVQQLHDSPCFIVLDSTFSDTPANDVVSRLHLQGGGVKFDLNLQQAKRRRLVLDAKLLRAAHSILSDETSPASEVPS